MAGAPDYFDHWTSKRRPTGLTGNGYYSFDAGSSWHVIALNSQCSAVPCIEGSAQNDFLEQDLASTTKPASQAYWRRPYFNSGVVHGGAMPSGARAFWNDLYAACANVILNGHEHNYQRYAKQDPLGQPSEMASVSSSSAREGRATTASSRRRTPITSSASDRLRRAEAPAARVGVLLGVRGLNGTVLDSGGPVPCN
jgi:hypothetical protein